MNMEQQNCCHDTLIALGMTLAMCSIFSFSNIKKERSRRPFVSSQAYSVIKLTLPSARDFTRASDSTR